MEVVPDDEWDPAASHDRGVVLYGNADTNSAWDARLRDSLCPGGFLLLGAGALHYEIGVNADVVQQEI